MKTYDWYKIINLDYFNERDLPSLEVTANFESRGLKPVMVVKGAYVSVIFEGVMLSVAMSDLDPFEFEGYSVNLDENNDIWIGIEKDAN